MPRKENTATADEGRNSTIGATYPETPGDAAPLALKIAQIQAHSRERRFAQIKSERTHFHCYHGLGNETFLAHSPRAMPGISTPDSLRKMTRRNETAEIAGRPVR